MPYCSGMGNLIFAFILGRNGGSGADVMTNSLVNNVTNMTLVLGLPAIFWGIKVLPSKATNGKNRQEIRAAGKTQELNRLVAAAHAHGGFVFHRRGLGDGTQGAD